MDPTTTSSLTLHPFTVPEARRILAGDRAPGEGWEGGYAFADEMELVRAFLDIVEEEGDPAPFGPYLIRRGDGGPAVGAVTFYGPPDATGTVEFAFALVPAVRGQGLAREVVRLALGVAAANGAARARADAEASNVAAVRAMRAAGMHEIARDATMRRYERHLPTTGQLEAIVLRDPASEHPEVERPEGEGTEAEGAEAEGTSGARPAAEDAGA
ncbi:GNAT family N-acetyltransferase [Agromyces sp. SYSU T00194]|uniref:GNAT family N-acetyltransferase n=1 Tax=Agromyces chitinivorans TaxID=3158560 RepID=UPI0033993A36